MPATLRLSKTEQKLLERRCVALNKQLIKSEQKPISESELAHFVLEEAIAYVSVSGSRGLVLEAG